MNFCMLDTYRSIAIRPCTPNLHPNMPLRLQVVHVNLQIQRQSRFYVQNVVFMMFGLSVLGLLSYAMPTDDIGDRVNTLLTLILTSVAFKFILASSLPKVPYNTMIDHYVMLATGSLIITAFLSVVPQYVHLLSGGRMSQDDAVMVNVYTAAISGALVISSFFGWLLVSRIIVWRSTQNSQPVRLLPGKNWYSFRYNLPHFLVQRKGGQ